MSVIMNKSLCGGLSEMSLRRWCIIGAVGVGTFCAIYRKYKQRVSKLPRVLNVPDYEKDKIYMFFYPRPSKGLAQPSPFALKLESWFRMNNLDYEYVATLRPSSSGQSPYVEYNGEEITDSTNIILQLSEKLHIDNDSALSAEERAVSHATRHLCEFSLIQTYFIYRYLENLPEFMEIMRETFSHYINKPFGVRRFQAAVKHRMSISGYGRLTPQQVQQKAEADITAISDYLGDKPYFMGERPTTIDCWLFAHLAQIMYAPMQRNPQREFVESPRARNVQAYVDRVRAELFPDWDRLLAAAAQGRQVARA